MGTGELSGQPDKNAGSYLQWTRLHPGGVAILIHVFSQASGNPVVTFQFLSYSGTSTLGHLH